MSPFFVGLLPCGTRYPLVVSYWSPWPAHSEERSRTFPEIEHDKKEYEVARAKNPKKAEPKNFHSIQGDMVNFLKGETEDPINIFVPPQLHIMTGIAGTFFGFLMVICSALALLW